MGLLAVRGRNNTDDVWAVGGDLSSLLLHCDGDRWVEIMTEGVGPPLNGVWTGPDPDVWVAGHSGTTGAGCSATESWWMPSIPVMTQHLHGVSQHAGEVFWVGGKLFSAGNNVGTLARSGEDSSELRPIPCE